VSSSQRGNRTAAEVRLFCQAAAQEAEAEVRPSFWMKPVSSLGRNWSETRESEARSSCPSVALYASVTLDLVWASGVLAI
jgi:hypothetical protein